jgi:transposase
VKNLFALPKKRIKNMSEESLSSGKYLTPEQRNSLKWHLSQKPSKIFSTRIEIMLFADEGKSQSEICKILGCTPSTASRWITLAHSGMSHQWNLYSRGCPKKINQQYLQRLKELVSRSPRDFDYPFEKWTGDWLAKHLAEEFGIKVTKHHINRLLKEVRPIKIQDLSLHQSKNLNHNSIN